MKPGIDSIFSIKTSDDFKQMALAIFKYQITHNEVYRNYITALKVKAEKINELEQIPFLPIEFFKSHKVISENKIREASNENQETRIKNQESKIKTQESRSEKQGGRGENQDTRNENHGARKKTSELKLFTSSGNIQSKHYVTDVSVYEKSYQKAFELFYGNIREYCILALLPSYLERDGSSLIYMAENLIKCSKHPESGFYLNNYAELSIVLKQLDLQKQKTILLGVTFALLDIIENGQFQLKHTVVMETGGMKGKRKEMVREELHAVLCKGFGVDVIHSEYGMTELFSQAYSKGNGIFNCPPWMKVLIRDTNDPFSFLPHNKSGGINIIDLANVNSCSFIATQDLGKTYSDNSFEVLGRFDNSDIRGCNLLVE